MADRERGVAGRRLSPAMGGSGVGFAALFRPTGLNTRSRAALLRLRRNTLAHHIGIRVHAQQTIAA